MPRDPSVWVDLQSTRVDAGGLIYIQMSLSGNPTRPRNFGMPVTLVNKALNCGVEGAVYDVDVNGNAVLGRRIVTPDGLTGAPDSQLYDALFRRICVKPITR